eukprot:COSAG03_NODE_1920_length_3353_cov_7.316226_7_plen_72_part_01
MGLVAGLLAEVCCMSREHESEKGFTGREVGTHALRASMPWHAHIYHALINASKPVQCIHQATRVANLLSQPA